MRTLIPMMTLLLVSACAGDDAATTDLTDDTDVDTEPPATRVRMQTTMGDIVIELYEDDAPTTTANFLAYVDQGFYDGDDGLGATVVHRVVPDFVVQGGGYTAGGTQKTTLAPIPLELDANLSNVRGTVAMARTTVPDSATSQWFVNLVDNPALDRDGGNGGYAVFGEVVVGMDVVDAIAAVELSGSEPVTDIIIEDCTRE